MERETGFEPATPSLEGLRSSQLSYSRVLSRIGDLEFVVYIPQSEIRIPQFFSTNGGEGRFRTSVG